METLKEERPSRVNSIVSTHSVLSKDLQQSHVFSEFCEGQSSIHSSVRSTKARAKTPKNKGKLEDQMNNENLQMLQQIFLQADEDCGGGLDIDEFGKAMKMAFQHEELDDKQLNMLFMKVDTNCDGTVDWEEFCDYMLLENQQKDTMSRDVNELPFPNHARPIPSPHHDTLTNLTYLPSLATGHGHFPDEADSGHGRYISCSKDGMIVFWGQDFQVQRTAMLGDWNSSANKTRPIWVTCIVSLANVKKIAVATTERDLSFFDCSGNNFDKQYGITGLQHCVISMDYWYHPSNPNQSILLFGDTGGGVTSIMFSQALVSLFDVSVGKLSVMSNASFRRIHYRELLNGKNSSVKALSLNGLHEDWVRKVKYIPNLQCFISCSSTNNSSLYLGDIQRKKMKSYFKIRKGVYTFDYDKDNNVIITGGPDRIIRLWNPYVTNKATSVLKGHLAPIANVIMDGENQHIISISKDKMIKVWDMRDQLCIQTIPSRLIHIGQFPLTTAYYNARHMTLLLGGNSIVALEKKTRVENASAEDEPTSHCKPLCAAIYNDLFNQVVSACHGALVNVWQLETGEKSIMFKVAPEGVEITAISFDPTKRRLITGTRDGTVKVWNFNNGACLRELHQPDDCEITGIVCPKQKIVFVGWNQKITIFRDVRGAEEEEPKVLSNFHKDDILCVDIDNSNIATTASYDGQIAVWNIETGHIYCQFNVNNVKGNKKYQGYLANSTKSDGVKLPPIRVDKENITTKGNESVERDTQQKHQGNEAKDVSTSNEDSTNELLTHAHQHLSVDKVLFLNKREHERETASLLSSAGGFIQAWSVHGGGLLGQFRAAHSVGESVLAITTDDRNLMLITGDSAGYLTVWDISDYLMKQTNEKSPTPDTGKRPNFSSLIRSTMLHAGMPRTQGHKTVKKSDGFSKLMENLTSTVNTEPPDKMISFRAHTQSIVSVSYAEDKQLIITASTDCCVRVWNIQGRYIGTFGQKTAWLPPDTLHQPKAPKRVPADIQRIASQATLKVLTGSSSRWRIATNIIRFLGMSRRRSTHPSALSGIGAKSASGDGEQGEQEIHQRLQTLRIPMKDILGKNYVPKKRHKVPPNNIKQKIVQNQCIVYASLPYTELRAIKEPQMPPVLAKKMLQKSATNVKNDTTRSRAMYRARREGSVFQSNAFARRASIYRGNRT